MVGTSFKVIYSEFNKHAVVPANVVSNSQQITISYEDRCDTVIPIIVSLSDMESSVLGAAEEQSFEEVQVGVETFTDDEWNPLICGNVITQIETYGSDDQNVFDSRVLEFMTLEFTYNQVGASSNKIIAEPTLDSQINVNGNGYLFSIMF